MTNEFILTNYITNYITNYTEITNCGLNNNTIYNLVKTPNSNAITISLTISVIAVIVVLISYIIILTRNCICNKENILIKEIKRQNKIIKYLYIIQYDFIPYIEEINNIYYNFKFNVDFYKENVFYIINGISYIKDIVYYSLQYLKCIENIKSNLEKHQLEINKSYNIFYNGINSINKNFNEIYKNISNGNISKNENIQDIYKPLFLSYFEYIRKYINNIKFLNNIEIDSNLFNKIKIENKDLYEKIEEKEKELINITKKNNSKQ